MSNETRTNRAVKFGISLANFQNERGSGVTGVLVAVGLMGVVAAGTMQLISNMQAETRGIRQTAEAGHLQQEILSLLSKKEICTLNFGTARFGSPTAALRFDEPTTATPAVYTGDFIDASHTAIYKVDDTTTYEGGTLRIKSFRLIRTATLQATPPAVVTGKVYFEFIKNGQSTGSQQLIRSINIQATLSGAVGTTITECSATGTDDVLWARLGDIIHNTNPGGVGVGTIAPNAKLDVMGGVQMSAPNAGVALMTSGAALTAAGTKGWHIRANADGSPWNGAASSLGFEFWNGASATFPLTLTPNGSVGIGTNGPANKFHVQHGSSSVVFGDEAGASVMRLKANAAGGVAAMIFGNSAYDHQLRINSDNTLALGHYTAPGALQGFVIRPNATVNGNTYTGTVFEFGQAGGGTTARVIGASGGAVFQGLGSGATLVGNWDGGNLELYSQRRTTITAGSDGAHVGSAGGDVELLASGAVRLNSSSGQILANGATVQTSDERLKTKVLPLEGSLDRVLELRGVSYDWKDQKMAKSGRQIGLIAQQVESVYPEVVHTDAKTGTKSLAYDHLIAPVIEAVKALHARLTEQASVVEIHVQEIAALKDENQKLRLQLEEMNARLDELESRVVK